MSNQSVGQMITKALLSHFHKGGDKAFLPYLPPDLATVYKTIELPTIPLSKALVNETSWVMSIHYSWFVEPLKRLPEKLQMTYLRALPLSQAKKIAPLLPSSPPEKSLNSFVRPLFLASLKKELFQKEILPLELLPHTELNGLLSLSKAALVHIIDLLGVYDLAVQLKQIVDKSVIETTKQELSKEQLQFLPLASRQPAKWIPPKIDLSALAKTPNKLKPLLHKRGLVRFAKALVDENPSLIWHIERKFDQGRGMALHEILQQKHDLNLVPYFKQQLIQLVKEMKA